MSAGPGAATLLVRGIGSLVTCDPERGEVPGVVSDAVVAARGERIVHVGPAARAADLEVAAGAVVVDAGGSAAVPGFVDAHTHAIWMGSRADELDLRAAGAGYEEIAAAGGGIRATVRATAAAGVDELAAAARPRLARMLAHGATTVEVKSGYGLELAAELRELDAAGLLDGDAGGDPGMPSVVRTYLPFHALPAGERGAFVDEVIRRGLRAAAGRASCVDAFCERGAYSVAECASLLEAARAHGLRAKLHAEQLTRTGGALLAARSGAVSADHLEHATDEDLAALAAAGVVGVVLPGAALAIGGPPPPGRRLLDAGATVAVATDCNPGTCWSESMPLMVALAVATAGLTPAQAIVAATAGGAAALSLTDRGVLRPGMRCDLAVLDTKDWRDLAYHLGANPVRAVVRAGRLCAPPGRGARAGADS